MIEKKKKKKDPVQFRKPAWTQNQSTQTATFNF